MPLLHLVLVHVPQKPHRGGRRIRYDERLQEHLGIAKTLLDLLDRLVKLDLGIARPKVSDAFWIHENDMLLPVREQPEDEVGVEVAGLEKADASPLAQVAQQVELPGLEESPFPSWNALRSSTNWRSPLLSGAGLISTIFESR